MNKNILNTGVQDFIENNLNADIMSVVLKKSIFPKVSSKELAEQIEAKKKCLKKLPSWYNSKNIYYPNKLNIEQCSSEITAEYKAGIVDGKSLLDLSGGFGVDSYYFSKKMQQVIHCEINEKLSQIASHNFDVLGVKNIETIQADGLVFLDKTQQTFDWIYLDPSRRSTAKEKVFILSDCTPNIVEHLELLFSKTKNILLKTSPLLDLSLGIQQLKFVKEIHIVAVNNDVKELLWVLKRDYQGDVTITPINFAKKRIESFRYLLSDEKNSFPLYSLPLSYLYEPNASILKSGAFKNIAIKYNLQKLHENTHLYTSSELLDFPGRRFKILNILEYNKKGLKKLDVGKANITTRNFPYTVVEIRKRFKIKDGGDNYLFFTKSINPGYLVIECQKI